jgi:inosose dehydratase
MSLGPRIRFASAPVSWGIQDERGPAWEQGYERILGEIVAAGYTGTELGPYGYFPTDPAILRKTLQRMSLTLLSSFVPVSITEPGKTSAAIEHVRRVGSLLSALGASVLVLSDCQTAERRAVAGRVPVNGSKSLRAEQWKQVGAVVGEVEKAAAEYGLGIVFHPHVATFVETPSEVEALFDAISSTHVGLCLDSGHCVYGGGDPTEEAAKYGSLLRYVHIKDIDPKALGRARAEHLDFEGGVGAGVFCQIGEGCIDFESFFRALDKNGYSGWAVVEQDVIYGKTKVPPLETSGASLDYLNHLLSGRPVGSPALSAV